MKKSKRIANIILIAALAVSITSGCSSANSSSSVNSSSPTSTKESEALPEEKTDDVPFATIKWYVPGTKSVDHEMVLTEVNKSMKEKINAALDFQVIDNGTYNDKMKLIISSGEDYDLCFTASWKNDFVQNVGQEAFMPLDDLLNKYGQDILNSYPSAYLDGCRVNGEIYAVPTQSGYTRYGMQVQKRLAEKYNLDITTIKKVQDLEPFLQQVKEGEPDLIPYQRVQPYLLRAEYEALPGNALFKRGDTTLTVVSSIGNTVNEAQEKLDNEWYKKGYIRSDIVTMKDESGYVKENKFAVLANTLNGVAENNTYLQQGLEYLGIPLVDGRVFVGAATAQDSMTAMNVNCKNPEAAMKVVNLIMSDKEVYNLLTFGIEGVHHTKVSENQVTQEKDTTYSYMIINWEFGNPSLEWLLPDKALDVWDVRLKMFNTAEISLLSGFTFDPSPVQTELAQIDAVNKEYSNGQYPADDLAAYQKERDSKLTKAGYDVLLAELQKQIDDWAKATGKK